MYPQSVSGTNSNVSSNSCPPPTHTPSLPAPLRGGRNFALGWLGLLLYLTLISSLRYICMVAVASISLNLAFLYVLLFVYVITSFPTTIKQLCFRYLQVRAKHSNMTVFSCQMGFGVHLNCLIILLLEFSSTLNFCFIDFCLSWNFCDQI